jgi:hypothetical protein
VNQGEDGVAASPCGGFVLLWVSRGAANGADNVAVARGSDDGYATTECAEATGDAVANAGCCAARPRAFLAYMPLSVGVVTRTESA